MPVLLVALAVLGFGVPVQAEEGPLPDSCDVHPTHVVNPGCIPALTSDLRDPGITYPNVVPDVRTVQIYRPFVLDEETQRFVEGPPHLGFDAWVQNLGSVPLDLAVDEVETANTSTVSQCVSWTEERVCRDRRVVGGYTWHQEHGHFHFAEFSDYQLRRLAADGRPDYSAAGLVARGEKVGFCFVDIAKVRDDASPVGFYKTCLPTVQGVSPGWADVYDYTYVGQYLPIDADGRYAIVINMDYGNRLFETDDTDNVVEITVEVSGGLTEATILGRHYP